MKGTQQHNLQETKPLRPRREGDLVTITSRQDLIRALNEAVLAGESMGAGHGPRLGQQMLPALRISVVEVPEVRELVGLGLGLGLGSEAGPSLGLALGLGLGLGWGMRGTKTGTRGARAQRV